MPAKAPTPIAEYVSVQQFATYNEITRARVHQLLIQKRIPGARRIGRAFVIPRESNIRPAKRKAGRPSKKAPT